jgi:ribosomal protein S18 acetylase RimI-like enzyme
MTTIIRATQNDFKLLADLGKQTFIESHGHSALQADINEYVSDTYSYAICEQELADANNIFHFLYYDGRPAGYSKIIFNSPHPNIQMDHVTKLQKIFLLKEFYSQKLGKQLFNFNVDLSNAYNQKGIWLFVWKKNERAIKFYQNNGFKIIGDHDFKISDTHTNPNHIMFLKY